MITLREFSRKISPSHKNLVSRYYSTHGVIDRVHARSVSSEFVILTVRMSRKSVNDRTAKYNTNVIDRARARSLKLRICVIDRAHGHGRLPQEG